MLGQPHQPALRANTICSKQSLEETPAVIREGLAPETMRMNRVHELAVTAKGIARGGRNPGSDSSRLWRRTFLTLEVASRTEVLKEHCQQFYPESKCRSRNMFCREIDGVFD